ncbi:MAG TPA: hypothetical protein DCM67_03250, partial [Propionibacteriaceae bacterium]|nr:hypothetical protein [Propionibacteriaceae bacterium]
MSWKDRFVDFEPRPEVEYPLALGVLPSQRTPGKALALGIGGALMGLLVFWIIRGYIALAVIWLLGILGKPRFRLRFGWVDLAVLLLVAWHTIAALWAASHLSPRPAVNMLWEWVGLAVSFFLARQLLAGRSEARAAVAVMGSLAVALAA